MAGTKQFTIYTKFAVKNGFSGPVIAMAKTADKLHARLNNAKKIAGEMGKDLAKIGKAAAWAGAGIAAATAATWKLVDASQQSADDIQNTANALGLTTDALQEYRYVGIQAGLTTEDMDTALTKLTKNIGNGGPQIEQALYQIGVSADQLKNTSPDQTLELIADGFARTKDPAVKAAVAMQLFGKSSVRMVNALNGGAKGIKLTREEAQKLGYVMKDGVLTRAGDLNNTLDKLGATAVGLRNRLSDRAVPGFQKLTDSLQAGIEPGGKYEKLIGLLGDGMENLTKFAGDTLDFFANLAPAIEKAAKDLAPFVAGVADLLDKLGMAAGGQKKDIFWSPGGKGGLVDSAGQGDFSGLNGLSNSQLTDLFSQTKAVQSGEKGAFGGKAGVLEMAASGNIQKLQDELAKRLQMPAQPRLSSDQLAHNMLGVPMSDVPLGRGGGTTTTINRSEVAITVGNLGKGGSVKQDRAAPGVTLKTGQTVRGGGNY